MHITSYCHPPCLTMMVAHDFSHLINILRPIGRAKVFYNLCKQLQSPFIALFPFILYQCQCLKYALHLNEGAKNIIYHNCGLHSEDFMYTECIPGFRHQKSLLHVYKSCRFGSKCHCPHRRKNSITEERKNTKSI